MFYVFLRFSASNCSYYIFIFHEKYLLVNPRKWYNTLKQFVAKLPTNRLSVFDHLWDWRLKGKRQKVLLTLIIVSNFYMTCKSWVNLSMLDGTYRV